jgi:hypothetical protein
MSKVLSIACEKHYSMIVNGRNKNFHGSPKGMCKVDIYKITWYSFSIQLLGTRAWSKPQDNIPCGIPSQLIWNGLEKT